MVEPKDRQQEETEGKSGFHSRLTLIESTFASLKVCNLKHSYICRGLNCTSTEERKHF